MVENRTNTHEEQAEVGRKAILIEGYIDTLTTKLIGIYRQILIFIGERERDRGGWLFDTPLIHGAAYYPNKRPRLKTVIFPTFC